MELALEGNFGTLVTLKNGKLGCVELEDVVGNNKEVGARSRRNRINQYKDSTAG